MGKNPTKKQRELFEFIKHFIHEKGYGPSYREIMRSLDYKSVSTVATHIDNLIALGFLRKTDHSARSLEIVSDDSTFSTSHKATPTQEKWLIDIITERFQQAETKALSQKETDDLFVLVGALSVLGFKEAAESFKGKLKDYR